MFLIKKNQSNLRTRDTPPYHFIFKDYIFFEEFSTNLFRLQNYESN